VYTDVRLAGLGLALDQSVKQSSDAQYREDDVARFGPFWVGGPSVGVGIEETAEVRVPTPDNVGGVAEAVNVMVLLGESTDEVREDEDVVKDMASLSPVV
jgi:hypothetical protein